MTPEIRWLGRDDSELLHRFCDVFKGGQAPERGAAQLLDGGAVEIVVATADGAAAGWAVSYVLPHVDGTIMTLLYDLEVDPAYRRCGIGRALMAELLRRTVERKRDKLWLLTPKANTPGVELYRRLQGVETDDIMFVWAQPPDAGADPELLGADR